MRLYLSRASFSRASAFHANEACDDVRENDDDPGVYQGACLFLSLLDEMNARVNDAGHLEEIGALLVSSRCVLVD